MGKRDDEARERARAEAEEQAWRDIVSSYGAQPDIPGLIELTTPLPEPDPEPEPQVEPFIFDLGDDESFTPPPLPPPAEISPERRLAWVGLIACPVLLVLVNLVGYSLPGILTAGLVIAFVGSFAYLVATMTPRDPDDDGARV